MNRAAFAIAVVVAGLLPGCGRDEPERLLVSAASSLTEVFAAAEVDFERLHPEIDIELNVGGSGTLVNQIVEGAPVAIIATADRIALEPLGNSVLETEDLAVNTVVFIHRTDTLSALTSLDGIDDNAIVVACDAGAPCGRSTRRILDGLDRAPEIDSVESNVRAVLRRIVSGEADAGFVYRTDVPTDADIGVVDLGPTAGEATAVVAVLERTAQTQSFMEFVRGGGLDDVLAERGFDLR